MLKMTQVLGPNKVSVAYLQAKSSLNRDRYRFAVKGCQLTRVRYLDLDNDNDVIRPRDVRRIASPADEKLLKGVKNIPGIVFVSLGYDNLEVAIDTAYNDDWVEIRNQIEQMLAEHVARRK